MSTISKIIDYIKNIKFKDEDIAISILKKMDNRIDLQKVDSQTFNFKIEDFNLFIKTWYVLDVNGGKDIYRFRIDNLDLDVSEKTIKTILKRARQIAYIQGEEAKVKRRFRIATRVTK